MSVDRSALHALVDLIPEADLRVTRKLLEALAAEWDVADASSEGQFTEQARHDLEVGEAYFDQGGQGIPHEEILKEFGLR
jgi:hypothetical protein